MLVFVQSIERAKELFHELVYDGINVDVIHSERTQAQRDAIVASFRAGRTWFLIATELLSRGMDFKGVNLVINYDFPQSTVSYIHRIGKQTARTHQLVSQRPRAAAALMICAQMDVRTLMPALRSRRSCRSRWPPGRGGDHVYAGGRAVPSQACARASRPSASRFVRALMAVHACRNPGPQAPPPPPNRAN